MSIASTESKWSRRTLAWCTVAWAQISGMAFVYLSTLLAISNSFFVSCLMRALIFNVLQAFTVGGSPVSTSLFPAFQRTHSNRAAGAACCWCDAGVHTIRVCITTIFFLPSSSLYSTKRYFGCFTWFERYCGNILLFYFLESMFFWKVLPYRIPAYIP